MSYQSNAFSRVVKQLFEFGPNFGFWVGLAKGLWKDKDKLLPSGGTPEEASTYANALNHTLDTLIIAVIPERGSTPAVPIPKLLDLMVLTRRTQHSGRLITLVSQPQGDLMVDYQNSIKPLISKLKDRYRRYSSSYFPVLDGFMQTFIERWLQDFLGEPSKQPEALVKKVNCVCEDCAKVNQFLQSTAVTETFRAAQKRRLHMEASLRPLSGVDTYNAARSLKVTKTQEVLATLTWSRRVQSTRAFLALVGTRDVLVRIMGERYRDVEAALAGTRPYKIRNSAPVAVPVESAPVARWLRPRRAGPRPVRPWPE